MGETESYPRFKTEAGLQRYLAACQTALADWPVACEALDIEAALGVTHVIASGPPDAPPLILLPNCATSMPRCCC